MEHDPAPFGPWRPLHPRDARQLMAGLNAPWWIGGGWAIDLFRGRESRAHADVDICLLLRDQAAVRQHFTGWDMQIAHDGKLTPWLPGQTLQRVRRHSCGIWARPSPDELWNLEFLFEDSEDADWLYRRNQAIRRPLAEYGACDREGIAFVRPEIALLHKATSFSVARHAADFEVALPDMDSAARSWLKAALRLENADHPWLNRL